MKNLILLTTLIFTTQSFANYKGVHCYTDPTEGSVYSLEKNDSGFKLFVNHLGGLGVVPISTNVGDVTLGSLDWIITKAKIFKQLGEQYQVLFEASDCKFSADEKYGMCEKENVTIAGIEFHEIGFYYSLGKSIDNGRVDKGDISLTYKIKDNSPHMNAEDGSPYRIHLMAIDQSFEETCVFRGM